MEESSNNLSIFSFKFVIFICLFVVIGIVVFLPYAPDDGHDAKYIFALNKIDQEEYEVAIFGNSYCYTAYDPTILQSELGLKTIHINSSAQNLLTSLIVAKKVIKEKKLKYAIFDVSEASMKVPTQTNKKSWYYQKLGLQEIPFSIDKYYYLSRFYPKDLFPEYYASALSKNFGRIFRLNQRSNYIDNNELKKYVTNGNLNLFGYNGYIAKKHYSIKKESFLNAINSPPRSGVPSDSLWSADLKKLMQEVISISQKENTEIILINSLKLMNKTFEDKHIDSIVKYNSNVYFINLNENKNKYFLNENSFYNSTHLSYSGSYEVTNRLVDSISKRYGLNRIPKKDYKMKILDLEDVFYNLEEGQDKFIKLEFNKLPKIINNHHLVISLYPKDTSLLSEYSKKRKWKVDNFYIKNPVDNSINVGKSKVLIKKLSTKITEENLERISIYFYNQKDSLNLPHINIKHQELITSISNQ